MGPILPIHMYMHNIIHTCTCSSVSIYVLHTCMQRVIPAGTLYMHVRRGGNVTPDAIYSRTVLAILTKRLTASTS